MLFSIFYHFLCALLRSQHEAVRAHTQTQKIEWNFSRVGEQNIYIYIPEYDECRECGKRIRNNAFAAERDVFVSPRAAQMAVVAKIGNTIYCNIYIATGI